MALPSDNSHNIIVRFSNTGQGRWTTGGSLKLYGKALCRESALGHPFEKHTFKYVLAILLQNVAYNF